MTLSDTAIKNPVFAWMLMLGMILFGVIGFFLIGKSQLPDVDFPVLTVSTKWEGASPEVMETEVVDVIENSVTSVKGVKKISSVARQGQSLITIEFDLKTDVDVASQEVQSKISQAQYALPKDIEPPIISKFNLDDQPFMWISLSGNRPTREITVDDVLAAIRTEHTELPAGYLSTPEKEWNLRVMGEAQSVEELKNLIIADRSGRPIYSPFRLKDIADVEDDLADPRGISRVDGRLAVGLGILKQRNANAVEVGRLVKKKVEELQKTLPQGMVLAVNFDGTMFIEQATHELNFNLILASILTSLICWLFLGSWSSAVNIILAIPTSILGTFIVLYFLGYTQNTFTLLEALTLAPMRCSQFLKVGENRGIFRAVDKGMDWLTDRYRRLLSACLGRRW